MEWLFNFLASHQAAITAIATIFIAARQVGLAKRNPASSIEKRSAEFGAVVLVGNLAPCGAWPAAIFLK